jgi:hypothetical protein
VRRTVTAERESANTDHRRDPSIGDKNRVRAGAPGADPVRTRCGGDATEAVGARDRGSFQAADTLGQGKTCPLTRDPRNKWKETWRYHDILSANSA